MSRPCGCGRCGGQTRTTAYTYAPDCPNAWEMRRAKSSASKRARDAREAAARHARRAARAEVARDAAAQRIVRGADLSHAEIDAIMATHLAHARYLRNTGQIPELTSVECWRTKGRDISEYAPGPGDLPTAEEIARAPEPEPVRKPKRHVKHGAVKRPRSVWCACARRKPLNAMCCTWCRKQRRKAA